MIIAAARSDEPTPVAKTFERAARHGVTVGADDEIAGQHASALGDDLMADAVADLVALRAVLRANARTWSWNAAVFGVDGGE